MILPSMGIEPATGLMSAATLEAKLVPVHLAGSSCVMAAIAALAERRAL